jgi:flagellar protein FlaF
VYHFAYDEIVDESATSCRDRERLALDRSIELLKEASEKGTHSTAALEALLYVRRLWSLLLEDLARPGNDLPAKLRADLISIGFWIMKEADLVRDDKSRNFKGLIDISSIIRDGLK